jgi:hypothetical protein
MPPKPRSGKTFDPYREALASLALIGQPGFTVVGGAAVGFGLGYGLDALFSVRVGRVVGLFVGLAAGIWSAGQQLRRIMNERKEDKNP